MSMIQNSFFVGLVILIVTLSTTNCQEKFEYAPMVASACCGNSFSLSVEDEQGNSLLSDPDFVSKLVVYSEEARQTLRKEVKIKNGKPVLHIVAPTPNARCHKVRSYLQTFDTKIKLVVDQKVNYILCTFLYACKQGLTTEFYGADGLRISSIYTQEGGFTTDEVVRVVFAKN